MMTEHDFTLVLAGIDHIDAPILNALFEAGCDDATPVLQAGTVSLIFARSAPDLRDAIASAVRDVQRSGINATIARVQAGDLVITDLAATDEAGLSAILH